MDNIRQYWKEEEGGRKGSMKEGGMKGGKQGTKEVTDGTRWFKYGCKQAAMRSSCATLRE
jgi:hypothetical protein